MSEDKEELEELKRNIISWYPFKENSSILEIWEGKENLEKIQVESFDYVVIIGLGEKELDQLINIAESRLNEDGKILIAVDNKIGINSLCSETNELEKRINRKTLENSLNKKGFINKKFYYPLPNYRYTNVVFTDQLLPNIESINRCITLYDENTVIALDERSRFKKIIDEDVELFKELSNSFLVECSKNNLEENNIKLVSFNNARKKQYRVKTIIQGNEVYKSAATLEAKQHIDNIKRNIDILKQNNINIIDTYDETKIISKYTDNKLLLNNIIINMAKEGKKKEIIEIFTRFKEELINKFEIINPENNCFDKYKINYEAEDIENLHFVKDGLWDMFFQNCFYIDNEFYFYDQEWLEENMPVEFILYRAIRYSEKELFDVLKKEELYEKLNLNEQQIKIFEKLDDTIQESIRNEKIWEIHKDNKEIAKIKIQINSLKIENTQKDNKNKELEMTITDLKNTITKQEDEIRGIKNSKSWKLTEPIRNVNKMLKGKEKQ